MRYQKSNIKYQKDKEKIKNILFIINTLILLFAFCILNWRLNEVKAQEMSSQNFKVQGGNFNMTSGTKSSANYRLTDVVGQSAANQYASKGYVIQSGFLNRAAGQELSFSISPSVVNFGNLSANQPVEKTIVLTIVSGDTAGYSVQASENQPLSTLAGAMIVDTRCDGDPTPCTQLGPAAWVKNVTYGFGYRMDGKTAPQTFEAKNFFAPLPAMVRNEQPVTLLSSKTAKVRDQATITLKVNVDANQPVGQYRNIISFIALGGI